MHQMIFKTADREEAAVLISCGYPLQNIQFKNPKQPEFEFIKNPELKDAVGYYRHKSLLVDPKKLSAAHVQIGDLISVLSGVSA